LFHYNWFTAYKFNQSWVDSIFILNFWNMNYEL
jgi:hypothetical protein